MNFIKIALNVIEIESSALMNLSQAINDDFQKCCELILACPGKVIITGIGKSGLIGKKISATLSSTGTPSIYLHPTEALHGDFGMIQQNDIVIALSHSGFTEELCKLIPAIKAQNIPCIAITSQPNSPLAQASNLHLCYGEVKEACPLGLAPTSSTTCALVLGDALAVSLIEGRQFREKDFAINHPGGSLGKKFMTAQELSHQSQQMPIVKQDECLLNALIEISAKKLGMCCVINSDNQLIGVLTDGDIRRHLIVATNIEKTLVYEVMNTMPKSIPTHTLALDALKIMKNNAITSLILVDETHKPQGILHIHDLLKAGLTI
ncbi:MAG: KpsF/GutQ family sugar-phosphate isomerase [Gammaproteobacteria bacterium]|nr:KpsF/GutQ family sugar-phosphate isomerase [Gammaproteobacteria bacterium]